MVEVPAALRARVAMPRSWEDWLARLPRLSADLMEEWELRPDGPAMSGRCAMAVPVRTGEDRPGVLKITWPHEEAETEHLALRAWQGEGASSCGGRTRAGSPSCSNAPGPTATWVRSTWSRPARWWVGSTAGCTGRRCPHCDG